MGLRRGKPGATPNLMGKPDLFAKRTFASRTETITGGAVSWKDAPEMGLEHVQSDGILVVHDPGQLGELPAPWKLAAERDEILLEFKMQGDHVDRPAVSRTLVRRQVRETQRLDEALAGRTVWLGSQTIWIASGYVPEWAKLRYRPEEVAPGCFCWAREHFTALWVASNELPLRDELVPFLITRTGRRLREFLEWVAPRNTLTWVNELVVSMRMIPRDFLKDVYPNVDEEGKRNIESWIFGFLEDYPSIEQELTKKTALHEARETMKRLLRLRTFDVRAEHLAKIDNCTNLEMLHHWQERAVTASSAEEALAGD